MSTDPATVTMAELEQSDPAFATQVRRARRRQDAEAIMDLARTVQQTAHDQKIPTQPAEPALQLPTEPEPIWR